MKSRPPNFKPDSPRTHEPPAAASAPAGVAPGWSGGSSSPGGPFPPAPAPPRVADHEMLRRIGGGSYGEVWLARNVMGTLRAVKVVYRSRFDHERPYEREFEGIRRFEPVSRTHESQVDILHIGRDDVSGCFYYVMELADDAAGGGRKAKARSQEETDARSTASDSAVLPPPSDWDRYVPRTLRLELHRDGRLPTGECIELGLALATALEHLHGHGLVHRDIKPSNIIYVRGKPKLADIGLVTRMDDTMSLVGTAGYLPPEGPGTGQGDIYSLGKVLYEACTGKDRQEFPELPSDLQARPGDDGLIELNEILIRACHHDPRKRYADATALREDLELLRAGKSVARVRKLERRWLRAKRVLIVAGLAVLASSGALLLQRSQTRAMQRTVYSANMNLAQRDWDNASVERLSRMLRETEPFPDRGFEWHFWQRQLHQDLRTFHGHAGAVTALAFSPDGRELATGGEDGSVRVWDTASGRERVLSPAATNGTPIFSLAWSPDGRRMVSGDKKGSARVWDAADAMAIVELQGTAGIVFGAAFSPDSKSIAVVSRVSHIRVGLWDAATGVLRQTFGDGSGRHGTAAIAFSPDGTRLAAITEQKSVTVWEVPTAAELHRFRSTHELHSLAFSPDGERIVTGASGEIIVWNLKSGQRAFELSRGHKREVLGVAFSPDGRSIATAGQDQRIIVWNAVTGTELFRLAGHGAPVRAVAFTSDGTHLATASEDGTAKLWAADGPSNPRTIPLRTVLKPFETTHSPTALGSLRNAMNALEHSPDGARLAVAVADRTVRLFETATGRELLVLRSDGDEIVSIAFSPDGRRLATGNGWHAGRGGRDPAKVWDSHTGQELLALGGDGYVAFSPDGRHVATSRGREAVVWDAESGAERTVLRGHTDHVGPITFSPDGRRLATSSHDGTIRLWDLNGRERLTIRRSGGGFMSPSFSPDGRRLVAPDGDRTARVWDTATGLELLVLEGHTEFVTRPSFAPDGRRILTGSRDFSAKLWDAMTGRELLTLDAALGGHTKMVTAASFSPDGRSIATAGYDGLIKIWAAAPMERNAEPE